MTYLGNLNCMRLRHDQYNHSESREIIYKYTKFTYMIFVNVTIFPPELLSRTQLLFYMFSILLDEK